MADPTGSNLTDNQVTIIERADPLDQTYKLAQRLQQLRVDLDAINAEAASTAAVLAALAGADAGVDINEQALVDAAVVNCTGVTARGGNTFNVICETGQGANLTASTGTKISWDQTGVSFFGVATTAQASHIDNVTDLATTVAAVNVIIGILEGMGVTATS